MPTMRDVFLEREQQTLSPYAFLTRNTRGRDYAYVPCEMRTEFQRDRDRIIHCQSFRRLMNKTQVFLAPVGDHYRTRLTHTLEVTQIARIIARALRLNEDLTEAAAMGHDLGHTPFGHAGEVALTEVMGTPFRHNEQSLRVVDKLEKNGQGVSLTWEVRRGIVCHSGDELPETLEGRIVRLADRIAYINHDIDDAVRAGILRNEDIPQPIAAALGSTHSQRINTLVSDVVQTSMGRPVIAMTPEIENAMLELRAFMFERVYRNPVAKGEESKARRIIQELYKYYIAHPEKLPEDFQPQLDLEGMPRVVCDYVAGMTDKYAVYKFEEIFVPTAWSNG